ncbi:putative F-box protein At3g58860 [Papaver somniferum]|uniref:putative F-box protein At3g58860 n=1 Tax=Papaver somniferum TaxID=3469 RepID=UPI000E6FBF91|nr:putative F-box protein At3g58860 [Papaver somniferum]
MSLPKLKHLKLGGVRFSNEYNNELLSLSNCPVLEDLTLENCEWVDGKNFCISAPSLENLKIISDRQDNYWVVSREPGLRYSGLEIHAPRLVSLTYKDSIPKDYVMSSSPTLVEADVDDLYSEGYICNATEEQKIGLGASAIGFLGVLSHVKVLSIADQLVESAWEALVALFRSAPNLESLVLNKIIIHHWGKKDDDNQGDDDWELDSMTTGCFLHLKSVCFKQFLGHPHEMRWVELVLENAKALQTMTKSGEFVKRKEEIVAELSNFHAGITGQIHKRDFEGRKILTDAKISPMKE